MKDVFIAILIVILAINTLFIYCCLKASSEVENDNKSSKNRDRETEE